MFNTRRRLAFALVFTFAAGIFAGYAGAVASSLAYARSDLEELYEFFASGQLTDKAETAFAGYRTGNPEIGVWAIRNFLSDMQELNDQIPLSQSELDRYTVIMNGRLYLLAEQQADKEGMRNALDAVMEVAHRTHVRALRNIDGPEKLLRLVSDFDSRDLP